MNEEKNLELLNLIRTKPFDQERAKELLQDGAGNHDCLLYAINNGNKTVANLLIKSAILPKDINENAWLSMKDLATSCISERIFDKESLALIFLISNIEKSQENVWRSVLKNNFDKTERHNLINLREPVIQLRKTLVKTEEITKDKSKHLALKLIFSDQDNIDNFLNSSESISQKINHLLNNTTQENSKTKKSVRLSISTNIEEKNIIPLHIFPKTQNNKPHFFGKDFKEEEVETKYNDHISNIPIIEYARKNDLYQIEKILEKQDIADSSYIILNSLAFVEAVEKSNFDVANILLKHRANIDYCDNKGETILMRKFHETLHNNNKINSSIITYLILNNADILYKNCDNKTIFDLILERNEEKDNNKAIEETLETIVIATLQNKSLQGLLELQPQLENSKIFQHLSSESLEILATSLPDDNSLGNLSKLKLQQTNSIDKTTNGEIEPKSAKQMSSTEKDKEL